MQRALLNFARAVALLSVLLSVAPARANFHLWKIDEVYSNSDGTIQFIELHDSFSNEEVLSGHTLTTTSGHMFTFPANLPSASTADHFMIIGTAAFASQPGAVATDYTIPSNFFSTQGDAINYAGFDSLTFTTSDLPTDGANSLLVDLITHAKSKGTNSPTNFATQSGSIRASPAHFWQNSLEPLDVNNDGHVFPLDALQVINALNTGGSHALPVPPVPGNSPPPFLDTTGDDFLAPLDALLVINRLNTAGPSAFSLSDAVAVNVPEPSTLLLGVLASALMMGALRQKIAHGIGPGPISGGMPTLRGHDVFDCEHAHEDVSMAPVGQASCLAD